MGRLLLRDLAREERVVALLAVGVLAREEHAAEHEDLEHEDAHVVPGVRLGEVDTELEHGPPVEEVEQVEGEQGDHNSDVVSEVVFVESLIIALIDGIVSISVTFFERLFLARCQVLGHLFWGYLSLPVLR